MPYIKLPTLPYDKAARVEKLDAPKAPPKPRPAVPARRCELSKICSLRKAGRCHALHCWTAAQYVSNKGDS